jgi:hypothetical protein
MRRVVSNDVFVSDVAPGHEGGLLVADVRSNEVGAAADRELAIGELHLDWSIRVRMRALIQQVEVMPGCKLLHAQSLRSHFS